MTDYMFSNNPNDSPDREEVPFTDVTHAHQSAKVWSHLVESCQRVLNRLEASGELSTKEAQELVFSPDFVNKAVQYESYFWQRVSPTLETHPQVRWNDCWKFNPDNALSDSEWKEFASGFNITANHKHREDPRRHYPDKIKSAYDYVRNTHESDGTRTGVSGFELARESSPLMSDEDTRQCFNFLREFPGIVTPSPLDDRPDWEWVETEGGSA